MTPQEQQLLSQLTERINQTQLQEKDPDAENLLGRALGANPDAMYILAQTVLVQGIALDQAKAQITQLQQQAQQQRPQPAHTTSFLGRLLGDRDSDQGPQQPPPYQQVPPQYNQQAPPQYMPPPPQQYAPQGYVPTSSGPPSFLRGAAQTAAGVAAGALAFEGVESILHGFGHGGGMGFGGPAFGVMPGMGMGGGFERPIEETVVNNYYDEPGRGENRGYESGGNEPHFHESADRGDAQFSDASYNTSDDRDNYDDNSDDGNSDDSSSNDDGGSGFDDGGDNSSGDLL